MRSKMSGLDGFYLSTLKNWINYFWSLCNQSYTLQQKRSLSTTTQKFQLDLIRRHSKSQFHMLLATPSFYNFTNERSLYWVTDIWFITADMPYVAIHHHFKWPSISELTGHFEWWTTILPTAICLCLLEIGEPWTEWFKGILNPDFGYIHISVVLYN